MKLCVSAAIRIVGASSIVSAGCRAARDSSLVKRRLASSSCRKCAQIPQRSRDGEAAFVLDKWPAVGRKKMKHSKHIDDVRAKAAELLGVLSQKLDAVEAEMKRIGYWSAAPSDLPEQTRSGHLRSFLDAPSFELWLQHVFLPNARRAVNDRDLPKDSSVGVMAMRQYDYHSYVPEAQQLAELLYDFDELIKEYRRVQG